MADGTLWLEYSAISDVGRVRKDNQDSGYAGPWLLAVCDGVGGAARGDIASSTALGAIRRLDRHPGDDPLALVAGALVRAHDRIAELVEDEPSLSGTSTTATVALFDGRRLALGHLGDSRAYLLRDGALSQLTTDHTFVQTLIDDGRITEDEARTHPHRNLILKALDGVREVEPDLSYLELVPGDRLLVCSDGTGPLTPARMQDILATGTPDYAAVELVRASLEAGSTDNITAVVADVHTDEDPVPDGLEPMLVGAVAHAPRPHTRSGITPRGLFRGHRSGDTGELDPVPADLPPELGYAIPADPDIDPETARYAPRAPERLWWTKRLLGVAVLLGLVWMGVAALWWWSQQQFYVGAEDGVVVIYRGLNADLPGVQLSHPYETSDVQLELLSDYQAGQVQEGIDADSLEDARRTVDNLAANQEQPAETGAGTEPGAETGTETGTAS